jgi:hypothetical protein
VVHDLDDVPDEAVERRLAWLCGGRRDRHRDCLPYSEDGP